jgi:hypothetical protein
MPKKPAEQEIRMRYELTFDPGGYIELPVNHDDFFLEDAVRIITARVVTGPAKQIRREQREMMNGEDTPEQKAERWKHLEAELDVVESFCRHLGFEIADVKEDSDESSS